MSHYNDIKTKIKNVEALIAALCRVKSRTGVWNRNQIEVHATAQHLYGFEDRARKQTAEIIIRRQHVGGAANDIGFKKQTDGTYAAIISDYDRKFYNTTWLQKVGTYYAVECSKQTCEAKGLPYKETVDEKNRPVIRITVGA